MASVGVGIAVAAVAWAWLFGLDRRGFRARAAVAGLVIGGYAALVQSDSLWNVLRPAPVDAALGVVAAAVIYGVFLAGERVLRRLSPGLGGQVDDLYLVRSVEASVRLPVPAVLVLVGCAEELFWRGFVQARAGFVVALVAYAAVHLWERKPVLVAAAVVGGAYWGALFAWRDSLVAGLVSHALWDLAVVVWFPLAGPPARR